MVSYQATGGSQALTFQYLPMEVPVADWDRLAQRVVAQRVALGYRRREDLANAIEGLSMRTLGDIESGRRERYHPSTLAALEHALLWKPGSIADILDGHEPTPQGIVGAVAMSAGSALSAGAATGAGEVQHGDPAIAKVLNSETLTAEQKRRIIALLVAEQEQFEKHRNERVDELIALLQR
jgi:hypothetical protein